MHGHEEEHQHPKFLINNKLILEVKYQIKKEIMKNLNTEMKNLHKQGSIY